MKVADVVVMLFARREGAYGYNSKYRDARSPIINQWEERSGLAVLKPTAPPKLFEPADLLMEDLCCKQCSTQEKGQGRLTLYHPLSGPSWIRLLRIEPGKYNSPLICQIQCFELFKISGRYETLSYSWQESSPAENGASMILANGSPLIIQHNLWYALRRIRHVFVTKTLWVDALW